MGSLRGSQGGLPPPSREDGTFPADVNIHGAQVQSELPEFSEGAVLLASEEACHWLSECLLPVCERCFLFTALFSSAYPGTTSLADVPPTRLLAGTPWGTVGAEV